jgi:hypothetical protein
MRHSIWRLCLGGVLSLWMFAAGCSPGESTTGDMSPNPDLAPHVCVIEQDTFDNGCLLAP